MFLNKALLNTAMDPPLVSIYVFTLPQPNWGVMIETKIFTLWVYTEKFSNPWTKRKVNGNVSSDFNREHSVSFRKWNGEKGKCTQNP